MKATTPAQQAAEALHGIGWSISWHESELRPDGNDEVAVALDAMATALSEWHQLELEGAPLDEVLATLGRQDEAVERTARLIELLGKANYDGGVSITDVAEAEALREEVYQLLDELLNEYDTERCGKAD